MEALDFMNMLRDLETSYLECSRRGGGGRRALSGFSYQFALSLDLFFQRVLEFGPAGATVVFDSMSDVAEATGDIVFFSQTKRTLSRSRLRDAWMEFLDLDRFLESQGGEVRCRARYRATYLSPSLR